METWLRRSRSNYEKEAARCPARQKQLSIALQRIDPGLWLSTDLCHSGLQGVQFPLGIVALAYSCSNIWCTHCNSNSCLYNMRTHNYPLLAYDDKRCNDPQPGLFLYLLRICILQVPRRQPRPGDSVMGRRVAFQCDVDVLMMVLHESNPVFPLILPRYLIAIIFTAFDLAAYI